MNNIDFMAIDWSTVNKTEHKGDSGRAVWQTIQLLGIRLRIVEYSRDYRADHWCKKGHIVYCLEGAFISEMENGESILLKKGMSYIVSDERSSHRSVTIGGAKLLIVDGDFLK